MNCGKFLKFINSFSVKNIMERTYVRELKKGDVLLKGWVHELRDLGKIKFLLLRDVTGIVQCVIKEESLLKKFSDLTLESVVSIRGTVREAQVKSPQVTNKKIEVEIKELHLLSKAEPLPISINEKIETGFAKRLDYRSLDLRTRKNAAIFKIQAAFVEGMQQWLNKNGFLQVSTPCLIGSASESGAEVFSVAYFNRKAFLRQDPQLHRQLTIAGGLEKIYDFGPNWRAEKSHTVKHLTEHRCMAVELAFIENEQDIMRVQEQIVLSAIKNAIEKCKEELEVLNIDLKVPKVPFPELKFPGIYQILKEAGKKIKEGQDLDAEAEKILAEYVRENYKSDFFFINGFPFKLKPFYVYHDNKYARSVDLYYKALELSSGGQREHRYDVLIKNIKEKKLNPANLEWFTKFFKYGVPPHGGFALGIERFTQAILMLKNIREACLFPRDTERLVP